MGALDYFSRRRRFLCGIERTLWLPIAPRRTHDFETVALVNTPEMKFNRLIKISDE
jgi:hypothetical protein